MDKNITQKYKVLIIGNSIIENTLLNLIKNSPLIEKLYYISNLSETKIPLDSSKIEYFNIDLKNFPKIIKFIKEKQINLIIPNLVFWKYNKIRDVLDRKDIKILAPKDKIIEIWDNRKYIRDILKDHKVPIPIGETFDNLEALLKYSKILSFPLVAKSNTIIRSKTAIISSKKDLRDFFVLLLRSKICGEVDNILVEKYLKGHFISVTILVDHKTILIFPFYYRVYSEVLPYIKTGFIFKEGLNKKLSSKIERKIIIPTVYALNQKIYKYKGILTFEIVNTLKGPFLVDLKLGFDPVNLQLIANTLESDFMEIISAFLNKELEKYIPKFKNVSALTFSIPYSDENNNYDNILKNGKNNNIFIAYGFNEIWENKDKRNLLGISTSHDTIKNAFETLLNNISLKEKDKNNIEYFKGLIINFKSNKL